VDGEKDVGRSHRENAIRVILVIFILDRPNPEEEYVEASVEGKANKVQ